MALSFFLYLNVCVSLIPLVLDKRKEEIRDSGQKTRREREKEEGVIGGVDEDNVSRLESAVLLRGSTGSTELP